MFLQSAFVVHYIARMEQYSFSKELDEMRINSEIQITWLQCLCLSDQLISTSLKAFRKGRMNYGWEVAPEAGSLNCKYSNLGAGTTTTSTTFICHLR